MRKTILAATVASALALALGAAALAQPKQPQQVVTPPKASYWLSASTGSGLMGFATPSQGQRPSMMDGMRAARQMMSGGGVSRLLELDLGSTLSPTGGPPKAEHAPAPALGVRGVLPLETPQSAPGRSGVSGQPERPKGRLLLFWGCGERARAGQPVIIDFARVAQGQWPTGLSSVTVNAPNPPSSSSSRTFGHWPNALQPNGAVALQGAASLLGEHVLSGNYTPQMRFTATQDFLAPVNFTTNAKTPAGAISLAWDPIPNATGYAGWTFGAKGDDIVFWSTSETKAFGVYQDFIPPGEAARLVRERALLAPSTTTCTVPVEVMDAIGANAQTPDQRSGGGALFFTAYGPEQNIIYPERPADVRTPWNQEWFVKIRHRSQSMQMLGQSFGQMAGAQPGQTPQPACPPADTSSAVGSAIGAATGIPGAGALGGAMARLGKKKKEAPPPGCPQ